MGRTERKAAGAKAGSYFCGRFIALLFLLCLAAPGLRGADDRSGTRLIRVGASEDFPLVHASSRDPTKTEGFFPDILAAAAAKNGWRIEYVWGTWEECLRRLERGEIDLLGAIVRSPERERVYDFNREVVLTTWGVLVAPAGRQADSWDDLRNARVAVQKGDIYGQEFLRLARGLRIDVIPVPVVEYSDVMDAVRRGQADFGVLARTFADQRAGDAGLHLTPLVFHPADLHFAAPKGRNRDILAALDRWLARAKQTPGSPYYAALQKWLHRPADHLLSRRLRLLLWMAVIGVLAAVTALAVGFSFRKQLRRRTRELRETVARLEAGERRYRRLLERAPVPIVIHENGKILFANAAAAQCVGADHPADLCGRSVFDFISPESRPVAEERIRSLTEGAVDTVSAKEEKFYRLDGTPFWAEVTGSIIDFEGRRAVQVVFYDVTARKRSEDALRERERELAAANAMLRLILDTVPVRVFWKDRESRYLGCNRPFAEDAGLISPEELIGRTDFDMGWKEQAELYRRDDAWVMQHRMPRIGYEEPQTRADGSRRILRTSKVPLLDPEGRLIGVLGCYEDITDQRRAYEERARLAAAVEAAAEGVMVTDPEGIVQYCNPALAEICGCPAEDIEGQSVSLALSMHLASDEAANPWTMVKEKDPWSGRVALKRQDGTERTVRLTVSSVRDSEDRTTGYVWVMRDITDAIDMQRQLEEAQRLEAIGQLAGGIAHDFRNILQAQMGLLDFALTSLPADHPAREDVREARKCADDAARLCTQLLSYGRKQPLHLQDLDLNRFLKQHVAMLQRVLPENIDIEFIPGRGVGVVRADPTQMNQVFMNLALNARDAMPEGGRLIIETENVLLDAEYCRTHSWATPGRYALVRVTDTGVGMSEDVQARIFEPFFTTKERGAKKGTGLGLAVVYGIVRQHEGMIRVYSEEGKGTTFKVYLPVSERRAVEVGPEIAGRPAGGRETVLVAEDNDEVRRTTVRILKSAGYTVVEARDGNEALRILEDAGRRVDAVVSDVVMPGETGRRLYERVRAIRPGLPFVFVSGYTFNGDHARFIREERLRFLEKPFGREALLQALREVLDEASPAETEGDAALS